MVAVDSRVKEAVAGNVSRNERATDLGEEYCGLADQIHGVYLDASMAMGELARRWMTFDETRRAHTFESQMPLSVEVPNPTITYVGMTNGNESDLHSTTIHELIFRNSPDGTNWVFLANMCVVLLYQFWEDQFRGQIAETLQLEKNALKDDVFGELNAIRQAIIHNHGRSTSKSARATVLKAFPKDQRIQLGPEDVRALVDSVKSAIRRVVRDIPSAAS